MNQDITWELLLAAYANGYFPMAESHDDAALHWFDPQARGVIPLDGFHVPASLAKFMKKSPFTLSTNRVFSDVIRACQAARAETWINAPIIDLYGELHARGFAHSVEVWQETRLVGGLYGVALGGAFFGESMFSHASNASKTALVHLVALLRNAGYTLLDTQFVNEHLKQFGVLEIPRTDYLAQLKTALNVTPAKCF